MGKEQVYLRILIIFYYFRGELVNGNHQTQTAEPFVLGGCGQGQGQRLLFAFAGDTMSIPINWNLSNSVALHQSLPCVKGGGTAKP